MIEGAENREQASEEENGFWLATAVQNNFYSSGKKALPFLSYKELLNASFQRKEKTPQDLLKINDCS